MNPRILLATALGLAASSGLSPPTATQNRRVPRVFTPADAERIAQAKAKRARKATSRAKEGGR